MTPSFNLPTYLNCMLHIPALSPQDLETAVRARACGDEWAKRLLEERFLPKVVRWVHPYRGRGLEFQALIELGNRALMKGLRQLKTGVCVDAEDFLESCVVREVESVIFAKK
jgi:DNA-directed RNA polymerase sigma subunit (sigma70/sigma32)